MSLSINVEVTEPTIKAEMDSVGASGTNNYDKLKNKPTINGRIVQGDFELFGDDVEYKNEEHTDVNSVEEALDKLFTKVYYVLPKIESFIANPSAGNREIGTVIPNIDFNWKTNKAMRKQTLTGCTIGVADKTATYNNAINSNKTFTLTVTDEDNANASASLTYNFLPNIYSGVASIPTSIDSEFVLGLANKTLKSSRSGTYALNITKGNYGWWCSPKSYGVPKCVIGGFETELVLVDTILLTNASGYSQDYYIYRTPNVGLGSISMVIS